MNALEALKLAKETGATISADGGVIIHYASGAFHYRVSLDSLTGTLGRIPLYYLINPDGSPVEWEVVKGEEANA